MNGFTEITEQYRQKHYPNGYFGWVAKHSGGIALIICGIVMILLGAFIGIFPVSILQDILRGELEAKGNTAPVVIIGIIVLAIIASGVLMIRAGVKRKMRGKDGWIQKCMEASQYPESAVQEFESQIRRTDAYVFRLDMSGGLNVLTTDYIMSGNLMDPCLMKISDITGAYLVSLKYTYYVGNKPKTGYSLNLALFSNHKTLITMPAKQDRAEYLTSILLRKNPGINTAGGVVLSEKQYDAMVSQMRNS